MRISDWSSDVCSSDLLFGGEERFCRRLLRFLDRLGFTATIAIASTPGAAHALARYGGARVAILHPGAQTEAIADLPLAALRLTPEALVAAARFGLERIADPYPMRSEEHTSELQSLMRIPYAVFWLKKKINI